MSVYRIQYGGIVGKPINYSEFLCDSIEDISLLPTNSINSNTYNTCSIGSIAYINGIKYILNNSGVWEINQQTKKALSNEIADPKTLSVINLLDEFLHKTTTSIDDYENEYVSGYLYATCPIETINNSNIKTIDAGAFEKCISLTSVELSNLITLENGGFNSCTSLSAFIAPKLEYVGYYSLYNTAITELNLPNLKHIGEYGLYSLKELTNINIPNIEIIDNCAFTSCAKLTSIDISNARSIGKSVFSSCSKLSSIILPDDLEELPDYMLSSCSSLTAITISDSIKSIGNYAFSGCSNLVLTDLNKVEYVGENTFRSCNKITSLSGDYVEYFTSYTGTYSNNSLVSISFPNLKHLGDDAFRNCRKLSNIYIPNVEDSYFIKSSSKTKASGNFFYGCNALVSINLPKFNPLTTYGMFWTCGALKNVNIPKVTSIDYGCFMSCSNLEKVYIPSVTNINTYAFTNCNNLTQIYLPNAQNTYTGAPWGAINATIYYECEFDENGVLIELLEEEQEGD